MAAQSSGIISSSSYISIDEEAVFTIRKLLWKHDKLCAFVKRRLPCFYTLLKRPSPWDVKEYISPHAKLLQFFDSKPEVFFAGALLAHSANDEQRVAYYINKIFQRIKTSEMKSFVRTEGAVAQETFSELIDALSLHSVGYEYAFPGEPSPQLSLHPQMSFSKYELLAHFQHARKQHNRKLAEGLAEKIFSSLKPGISVDPSFEKDFYEVLYGKTVEKEYFECRQRKDPSTASSSSSSCCWEAEPPHAVSYLAKLPSGSFQTISVEDKALTLIRFLRTALDGSPPNSTVINEILKELEKDSLLTKAVETLGNSILEEARDTLLALQLSLKL